MQVVEIDDIASSDLKEAFEGHFLFLHSFTLYCTEAILTGADALIHLASPIIHQNSDAAFILNVRLRFIRYGSILYLRRLRALLTAPLMFSIKPYSVVSRRSSTLAPLLPCLNVSLRYQTDTVC